MLSFAPLVKVYSRPNPLFYVVIGVMGTDLFAFDVGQSFFFLVHVCLRRTPSRSVSREGLDRKSGLADRCDTIMRLCVACGGVLQITHVGRLSRRQQAISQAVGSDSGLSSLAKTSWYVVDKLDLMAVLTVFSPGSRAGGLVGVVRCFALYVYWWWVPFLKVSSPTLSSSRKFVGRERKVD